MFWLTEQGCQISLLYPLVESVRVRVCVYPQKEHLNIFPHRELFMFRLTALCVSLCITSGATYRECLDVLCHNSVQTNQRKITMRLSGARVDLELVIP